MNQLTDLGPLSIVVLILFIGMLTVVGCVVGDVSRSAEGRESVRAVLDPPHFGLIQFLCCSSAHQQYLIVSVSLWPLGILALLWSGFHQLPVTAN